MSYDATIWVRILATLISETKENAKSHEAPKNVDSDKTDFVTISLIDINVGLVDYPDFHL